MARLNDKTVISRIENMARKVYRGNENAVYMLINDLEEFFEMNDYDKNVERMTSEEFDKYIEQIRG